MSEVTEDSNETNVKDEAVGPDENNVEVLADENSPEQDTDELEDTKKQLEKAQKDYLYLRADFDNYRKKMIEERSQWKKYGSESVLRELVGIVDNFDLALMTEVSEENLESFHQGVKMIRQEISSSLEKAGVREMASTGQAFDPNLHEALGAEESTEVEDGHILRVFKSAYKLHDRLLRPGQVIIAKKPSEDNNK